MIWNSRLGRTHSTFRSWELFFEKKNSYTNTKSKQKQPYQQLTTLYQPISFMSFLACLAQIRTEKLHFFQQKIGWSSPRRVNLIDSCWSWCLTHPSEKNIFKYGIVFFLYHFTSLKCIVFISIFIKLSWFKKKISPTFHILPPLGPQTKQTLATWILSKIQGTWPHRVTMSQEGSIQILPDRGPHRFMKTKALTYWSFKTNKIKQCMRLYDFMSILLGMYIPFISVGSPTFQILMKMSYRFRNSNTCPKLPAACIFNRLQQSTHGCLLANTLHLFHLFSNHKRESSHL